MKSLANFLPLPLGFWHKPKEQCRGGERAQLLAPCWQVQVRERERERDPGLLSLGLSGMASVGGPKETH